MSPPEIHRRRGRDPRAGGVAAALTAYLMWGLFPVYFRALAAVPALEILAHRIVWSALVLAMALTATRRWWAVGEALSHPRRIAALAATTVLVSANWGIFIWAVVNGRLVEASLGYFVNPLVNVALGALFLREALSRRQRVAVALAAAGVALLVVRAGALPWISLALPLTFGLYALGRKAARVDAMGGLLVETVLLAPAALAYLWWRGRAGAGAFGADAATGLLLAGTGVVTSTSLVLFTIGVRRLRLATVGLMQYLTPTCQLLLAVLVYREPFGAGRLGAFLLIWASLAVYTADALAARGAPAAGAGRATGSGNDLPDGR